MPPRAKTTCKLCDEPRHVYPSGCRSTYCREHMRVKKSRPRGGEVDMTGDQAAVLHYMRDHKRREFPAVSLEYPVAHKRTIRYLIERDWIYESPGLDGMRYLITGRGVKALEAFETMLCRKDGMCPRCNQRERHVRSGGHKDAYCIECLREKGRKKRADGRDAGDINRTCSTCHEQPRHRYPNGKYSTYCKTCERKQRHRNWQIQRAAEFAEVKAGGPVPLCKKCRNQPRRVFINCMSEYCAHCGRQQIRRSKARKHWNVIAAPAIRRIAA